MYDRKWMDELSRRAKEDLWCQVCQDELNQLEPAFRAFLMSLPEDQQQLLEAYLDALRSHERSRTLLAYHLGREHSA